jgi:gamma-glutamylcyclotransferase (GGCT)/AIG2-like uncharacterized protein YtfP
MAPGALPQERQLVFVYGTLKRGEKNHHWLEGASWQGEAELSGVLLHDLGPFPMAVIGKGTAIGEVYGVEEHGLARLDELEGYPRLYDRQMLSLNDGRRLGCTWAAPARCVMRRWWSAAAGMPPKPEPYPITLSLTP